MSKLLVLSVDSLFDEDMDFLRTLPNFGKLLKRAAYSRDGMRSVYPSFTYPAHASIITGAYPDTHGVFHNEHLDVGNPSPDWFWYHKDLKVETCIDAAKRAGLTTSVVGWPCMAACPNADYLIPEIWVKKLGDDPHGIFETGTSPNLMKDGIFDRHCHKLRRTIQPYMDEFMIGCSCDILRRYKPDVMFIHGAHLDHTRHANGIHGPAIDQAIIANDDWFGRLMEATMDAGTYEETNFVVLSDHGHLPVKRVFNPNVLFVREGLIQLDNQGRIVSWQAYCNSSALSAQVILRDPDNDKVRFKVEKLIYGMRTQHEYGVESVFTKAECKKEWRLTGNFEYVLEGMDGTSFGNAWTGSLIVTPDNTDYKFSVASHGHLPVKGPQPVFMMMGPNVREGTVIERHSIIDEAPTFAKMLHFDMPQAEGKPIDEIILP